MIFDYNGYTYWFSVIDVCYYKQKWDSFEKIEITEKEFNTTDEERWERYKEKRERFLSCAGLDKDGMQGEIEDEKDGNYEE